MHSEKLRGTARRRVKEEAVTDNSQFVVYSGLDRQPMKSLRKKLHRLHRAYSLVVEGVVGGIFATVK